MLQPRLFNPSGLAVSIATHLAVLTVGFGYAGVRPFATVPVEAIAVDLVGSDKIETAPASVGSAEVPVEKQPATVPAASAAAPPQLPQDPTPSAASTTSQATEAAPEPVARSSTQAVTWLPPEPDLTVKYQINLGLPARPGEEFDAAASAAARVSDDHIARFRERLKTCAVLPGSIAPTDKVTIRLRASFRPDGRLASAPLLIEASASAKGPALMQAAIHALEGCQPHAALPADKYGEWKVLDLSFTPQDFRQG